MNAAINPKAMSASVQILPLPAGVYLFSVANSTGTKPKKTATLPLPAIHVAVGPGVAEGDVEYLTSNDHAGGWLFAAGDFFVLRLKAASTPLLVTSIRDDGGATLSVKAERLDARLGAAPMAPRPAIPTAKPGVRSTGSLGLEIGAHIRNHGDLKFTRVPWAGRLGEGIWIESISLNPLEQLTPKDIEYKGLTASGFETPWISDAKSCGTAGMGIPLVGFAVRLKPGSRTANYVVEYTGQFQSGGLTGPVRNGAPCRSTVANDPLEGLQVHIVPRQRAKTKVAAKGKPSKPSAAVKKPKAPPPRQRR